MLLATSLEDGSLVGFVDIDGREKRPGQSKRMCRKREIPWVLLSAFSKPLGSCCDGKLAIQYKWTLILGRVQTSKRSLAVGDFCGSE